MLSSAPQANSASWPMPWSSLSRMPGRMARRMAEKAASAEWQAMRTQATSSTLLTERALNMVNTGSTTLKPRDFIRASYM